MVTGERTDAQEFQGLRVFIAEDESLILMLLEDILVELGCEVVGSALTLRDALQTVATVDAQAAILDINLGGDPIFPAAERLRERGIPLVFASGYGATTLPPAWLGQPTLPKPFSSDQVAAILRTTLGPER